MKKNGITEHASKFQLLGIRCFWCGIIFHTLRERRVLEALFTGWWMLLYWIRPVADPAIRTSIEEYDQIFKIFTLPDGTKLRARNEGVCEINGMTIACEYGNPGARVYVKHLNHHSVFTPYADILIWHFHSIVHLNENYFALSTGDSKKLLDVFEITPEKCEFKRRLSRYTGGFTAMIKNVDDLWLGTDYSERVNFILQLKRGGAHYLPRSCVREFIIHFEMLNERLTIITKRLNSDTGHALIFDTQKRIFLSMNACKVRDVDYHVPFKGTSKFKVFTSL